VASKRAEGAGFRSGSLKWGNLPESFKLSGRFKTTGMADKVSHRKVVIPGAVALLSGELEEELPDWKILVGPREAVDIPSYLKTVWPAA
jgi:CO dehydrogenase/acetyl-CoA synthase gamma subunit (corrinoid Fe-S protein)